MNRKIRSDQKTGRYQRQQGQSCNRARITRRTVDRLIKAYRERGKAAFSHGNKGRAPAHTRPDDIRQQILLLYENKYFDTNIRHFTELLEKNDGITISEGTARSILTTNHEFPYPKKISLDLDFLLFASNMLLFGFPFCKSKHQDGKFFAIYLHDKKWQFPGNKFLRHIGNYNMYCIRIFNYFPLCNSHIASKKSNMGIHDPKLPQIGSSNPQVCKSAGLHLLIQQPLP